MSELNTQQKSALYRQTIRWKAQEASGDLPDGLYEALADGAASKYEKRIIINLAKITRIISDSGIRTYSEFSKDWKYQGSIYGHADHCQLCGAAIKENCQLVNDENGDEILIGNVCVFRYIEIRFSDGRALTPTEKKEYLKTEMTQAKKDFLKADFASRYPNALSDLKRWESWTRRKWSPHASLHRTVIKRLATHGFLGPKTLKAWDEFYQNAEDDFSAYNEMIAVKRLEHAARLEQAQERTINFQAELASKRNQFNQEADEWKETAAGFADGLNSWQTEMIDRVELKIRTSGRASLTGGFRRFVAEMKQRTELVNGADIEMSPKAMVLTKINNAGLLNSWESGFILSVVSKMGVKQTLSDKQIKIVDSIIKKHGERVA
tara:strand:- start:6918 stop:8054 length:1137 start_codon:yes stop_codon:yes gene_type:complete